MKRVVRNGLCLRSMTASDLEAVLAIEEDSFRDPLDEAGISMYLVLPNHFAIVCERKGEIIGFLLYEKNKRGVYLSDVAVSKAERGRGAGRTMIAWLIDALPQIGCRNLRLHVRADNPAQKLYLAMGFDNVGFVPEGYPDGGDAFEMVFSSHGDSPASESVTLLLNAGR